MRKKILIFFISLIFLFLPLLSFASITFKIDTICLGYGDNFPLSKKASAIIDSLQQLNSALFPNDWIFISPKYTYVITNLAGTSQDTFVRGENNDKDSVVIKGDGGNAKLVTVSIEYTRSLALMSIPIEGLGPSDNSLSEFWTFRLLSAMMGKPKNDFGEHIVATSAAGAIFTRHIVRYSYLINKSMGSNWQPIIEGSTCLVTDSSIILWVDKKYAPFTQQWQAQGLNIIGSSTKDSVKIQSKEASTDYLYSVVYTVSDCKRSVSDTTIVGKTVPFAQISDSAFCIPIGETFFTDSIRNASDKLRYYWQFVDKQKENYRLDSGTYVNLAIPANKSGKIRIQTSGGCNTSISTVSIYRSLQPDSIQVRMASPLDNQCLFAEDTIRLEASKDVDEILTWEQPSTWESLPSSEDNLKRSYILKTQGTFYSINDTVRVFSKNCPSEQIATLVSFRKNTVLKLEGESCVSKDVLYSYTAHTGEGIPSTYQWNCNFDVKREIFNDTHVNQILIPITTDNGMFIAVSTLECNRMATDTMFLLPNAEKPLIVEELWADETACMPLGITDTIRLQILPQSGIDGFSWVLPEDWQTIFKDSTSITAQFLAPLSMQGKNVSVGVYATHAICGSSDTTKREISFYGANVNTNWKLSYMFNQELNNFRIGFIDIESDTTALIERGMPEEDIYTDFKNYSYRWFTDDFLPVESDCEFTSISSGDLFMPITPVFLIVSNLSAPYCFSKYSVGIPQPIVISMAAPPKEPDIVTESKPNAIGSKSSFVSISEKKSATYTAILIPNPAKDKTVIRFDKIEAPLRIEVLNSMGICIYQMEAYDNELEINTSSYASGVYFVRCINPQNGICITKKLMIR